MRATMKEQNIFFYTMQKEKKEGRKTTCTAIEIQKKKSMRLFSYIHAIIIE
jgi:hypothetical protein